MTEQEQTKHWIDNDKFRNRFWAVAGEKGLDGDAVHERLGVESMRDFEGTLAEALSALDNGTDAAPTAPAAPEPTQSMDVFEICQKLPEAPVVAFTDFVDGAGFKWGFTVRAGLEPDQARHALATVREQMEMFGKAAKAYGWQPYVNGRVTTTNAAPATKPMTAPPQPKGNGGPPAPAPAPQAQSEDVPSGTAALNAIKVDADGRVEFYVEGFKWPFKDGRGAEVVAGLFDADTGWKPEHFTPGAKYSDVGLMVDWAKPSKYYDVVRVHK